jgi:hypothetical protein
MGNGRGLLLIRHLLKDKLSSCIQYKHAYA